jgi:hypothetical protein
VRTLTKLLDDASSAHRKLDPADGLQDAQLDDGARVHIVHGDVARGGHVLVNIRKFTGIILNRRHKAARPSWTMIRTWTIVLNVAASIDRRVLGALLTVIPLSPDPPPALRRKRPSRADPPARRPLRTIIGRPRAGRRRRTGLPAPAPTRESGRESLRSRPPAA